MKPGDICQKKRIILIQMYLRSFSVVSESYKAVTSTILKKFTFNDHVFDDIAFLLPDTRCSMTNVTVQRLARLFPVAVSPALHNIVEEEVLDYRISPNSEFPDIEEGRPGCSDNALYLYWQTIGNMKTLCGTARFPNLCKLSKCLLVLPVSNAETERVFSSKDCNSMWLDSMQSK